MKKSPKKTSAVLRTQSRSVPHIRYAVVGLGYIAQAAVLPAFVHAKNSKVVALISSDDDKLKRLSKKYRVPYASDYKNFENCLREARVDAVYIALPNSLHREYAVRAARMGIHVLCEKPLALSEEECEEMIRVAEENEVKLMTSYRLHFDPANIEAIETARSGKLGDLRIFNSVFSFQVKDRKNIRLNAETGGGPLYDIGTYCINAARYLFGCDPTEVLAATASGSDPRFQEVEETVSAILRFPGERLATFVASFNAEPTSSFEIIGTKGKLRLDPAYEFASGLKRETTIAEHTSKKKYPKLDQFGPVLAYFSKCILEDTKVEPSGLEGLADIRVIEAVQESARTGLKIYLEPTPKHTEISSQQKMIRPPIRVPDLINATSPSEG